MNRISHVQYIGVSSVERASFELFETFACELVCHSSKKQEDNESRIYKHFEKIPSFSLFTPALYHIGTKHITGSNSLEWMKHVEDHRWLFYTHAGYVGEAEDEIRENNMVVIMPEVRFPTVLEPADVVNEKTNAPTYTMVASARVDGIMADEFI